MSAWYMAMWVCALTPVMSPIAHRPSAARIRSSTLMVRAAGSRPRAATSASEQARSKHQTT